MWNRLVKSVLMNELLAWKGGRLWGPADKTCLDDERAAFRRYRAGEPDEESPREEPTGAATSTEASYVRHAMPQGRITRTCKFLHQRVHAPA